MHVRHLLLTAATFALAACSANARLTPSMNAAKADLALYPAVQEQVLYSFNAGNDGSDPLSTLITDGTHALYGTTAFGGGGSCYGGCGTVYKLTPSGGSYTESILYSFQGQNSADGSGPAAGVVEDASGALYGTTEYGGTTGNGTVFRLTPAGSSYTETVLYAFKGGSDGAAPLGGLTMDPRGNLFGSTLVGGGASACSSGCGILFELEHSLSGYKERVLHRFQSGNDGATPGSPPIFVGDALYGTAATGGGNPSCGSAPINPGCGTIYKLTRTSRGYTFRVVYNFTGTPSDGANPFGGLVVDKSGVFYGITQYGGSANEGSVVSLTAAGSKFTAKLLHSFTGGADGSYPVDGPARAGDALFGTTEFGGSSTNSGIAFELMPSDSTYTENVLDVFQNRAGGQYPIGGLLAVGAHTLYGTTSYGGTASTPAGTVFRLTY